MRWQCNEKAGDLGYLREWGEIVGEDGEGGGAFEGYGGVRSQRLCPVMGRTSGMTFPHWLCRGLMLGGVGGDRCIVCYCALIGRLLVIFIALLTT